ncbi:LytR C-terminal domain-containing protein [Kribbella sp. NPDC055071]
MAAVVAIVVGLLVLFGTRGHNSEAQEPAGAKKPASGPSTIAASVPRPSKVSTAPPSTQPSEPTQPPETAQPTQTTQPPQTTQPTQPPATVPPPGPTTIPPAERPAAEIYNNTPRKGLAASVAVRARQAGWVVAGADVWRGKVVESTVYYPPGMLDAANQLAHDLGVGRTKGALDNMKKDRLTVILTSDYPG